MADVPQALASLLSSALAECSLLLGEALRHPLYCLFFLCLGLPFGFLMHRISSR